MIQLRDRRIPSNYEERTIRVFVSKNTIVIPQQDGFDLPEESEDGSDSAHNCDEMGCGQEHVIHRLPLTTDSAAIAHVERHGCPPADHSASTPEPAPVPAGELVTPPLLAWLEANGHHVAADLVRERDAYGRAKYGQGLMTGDERDTIEDARQELGDALQYVQKAIMQGIPLDPLHPALAALSALVADHSPDAGKVVKTFVICPTCDQIMTEIPDDSITVGSSRLECKKCGHGKPKEPAPETYPGPWLTAWPQDMPDGSKWEWESVGWNDDSWTGPRIMTATGDGLMSSENGTWMAQMWFSDDFDQRAGDRIRRIG